MWQLLLPQQVAKLTWLLPLVVDGDVLNSVMVYATTNDNWSTSPAMPLDGLIDQSAATVDDKVYVMALYGRGKLLYLG